MNAISKIIFDSLIAGQGINLPEIGSLYVEREAAKFISKTEIMPPANRVIYSSRPNEAFRSVIDIMVSAGKDATTAESEYAEWAEKAKSNRGLIEIPEVGVVKHEFFYPSASLHDTLNPGGQKVVKLKSKSGGGAGKKILTILVILIAIAVVLFFIIALDRYISTRKEMKAAEQTELVIPAEPAHKGEERKKDKKEKKAEEIIQEELEKLAVDRSKPTEVVPVIPECDNLIKEEKVSCWQKFLNLFCKKDKGEVAVEPTVERVEIPVKKIEEPPTPKHSTKPAVTCPSTNYYVVAGVFSSEANANRLIAQDKLGLGRNAYKKMPYKNGMTMVVVYSSSDRDDATRRMYQLRKKNKELWLYEE